MVNPYEPSGHTASSVFSTLVHQRWLAAAFVGWGVLSWASLFYALKDIRIMAEPGYQQIVHYPGFLSCAAFGGLAVLTGLFGICAAIRRQWHPWKVSLAYLIVGVPLCYAAGLVGTAYITGVEM